MVTCPFAPYGPAHGPKTCQIRQHLGQTLRNPYLSNRWIDLYHMKLYGIVETCSCATSKSFHLDYGFSRSNFEKMLCLKNGRADWHGTKRMWVNRLLDPHCDFELWPHPWPWPFIFKVKFWKSHSWCLIEMEQIGCKLTECWTHDVTFNFDLTHDLHLEFSTSNFEIAVSQEWEGWSTWNYRDMSRYCVIPTLWPWAMSLTLDLQGQIFNMLYLRNRRANWHGTKEIRVDRMLDSHCDFELSPHPTPSPWIFKVNFLNVSQEREGRSTWTERDMSW